MIEIKIKDVNGKILTLDSVIRLVNEDEEPIGETATVRLVQEDGQFEIRAFEQNYQYVRITDYMFVIEG